MNVVAIGIDTSPWNEPEDYKVAEQRLRAMYPGYKIFLYTKVCDGISKYPSGISVALRARDAGFDFIGPYGFHRTDASPESQAAALLSQWDKFDWNMRHAGDFESANGMPLPSSRYERDVTEWFRITDEAIGVPGTVYSSLYWLKQYFTKPYWAVHPLWLSQPPTTANYRFLIGSPTVVLPWLVVAIHQISFYNFLGPWFGSTGNNHVDLNRAAYIPGLEGGVPTPPDPEPDPDPDPVLRKVRCIVNTLSIRTGPSTTYPAIGYLSFGDIVPVMENEVSNGAEWVQHMSQKGNGWSCHHTTTTRYMEDI